MANSELMNARWRLVAVVLAVGLLTVGVWVLSRPAEADDKAIVDAVYDELLPPYVLSLKACTVKPQITGMLLVETHHDAIWLKGWKDALGAELDPLERTCFEAALKPIAALRLPQLRVPNGRAYEVDVVFSPPTMDSYTQ